MNVNSGIQTGQNSGMRLVTKENARWAGLPAQIVVSSACVILVICFAGQFDGALSIAVADEIAYITSGANLVHHGHYTNAFGTAEVWFPPVYPFMIGALSLGGRLDPHLVARIISLCAGIASVWLTFTIAIKSTRCAITGCVAVVILVCNPVFQYFAFAALSESLALTFCLGGFVLWMRGYEASLNNWIFASILFALATLTRPECVLFFPLLVGIDIIRTRSLRAVSRPTVLSSIIFVSVLFPYIAYLYNETGHICLTNKGDVNIAAGRSSYYSIPREYIDPKTLDMGYYPYTPSMKQETYRYLANCQKLFLAFISVFRLPGAVLIGLFALFGASKCWLNDRRLLFGLLAGFVYLLVVPFYDVGGGKNLHLTIPLLVVFAAIGFCAIIDRTVRNSLGRFSRGAGFCCALLLTVMLAEGGTRHVRWYRSPPTTKLLLQKAGNRLAQFASGDSKVYEVGATVGYYAGCLRGRLTPNDFHTITRYIKKHESPRRLIFMALDDAHSIEEISDLNDWTEVFRVNDNGYEVAVFQLRVE